MTVYTKLITPSPHGAAHVMLARQRGPAPSYITKELNLSFTQGLNDGSYVITPQSHEVRLSFVDYSDQASPVIYTQVSGTADLAYDDATGVLSGTLTNVVVENDDDDDDKKKLTIDVTFVAKSNGAIIGTTNGIARAA
ncbi:hypothetical protein ACYZTM_29205 [Pseudomonas sp. MDT2-39-1]